MLLNDRLSVAIYMITYNHEAFIETAIESVMMQQTSFEYKLFIGEDCSTDNTREICKTLQLKYPGKIELFLNEKNLGPKSNATQVFNACFSSGAKYVALLEGDDYWTDPLKLQKQVDYISKNDDCNMVFTDVSIWQQNENRFYGNWANIKKEKYEFEDLVYGNVISTCTILFRNTGGEVIQNWLRQFKIGDYPLSLLLLRTGYAYFLNDVTAVYRQHFYGVFSLKGPSNFVDTNIEVLQTLEGLLLSSQEQVMVRKSLVKWYYAKVVRMSNDLRFNEIRHFIKKTIKPSDIFINYPYFFRIMFLFCFPKLKSGVFEKTLSE